VEDVVDQTLRADQARRKASNNPPISRHPLFPAIVALWFGALFGLASIAIRPAFIEGIVMATGLDSIVPMAAPPLGTTARILVSLAMIGLGGVVGMAIARRIAGTEPIEGTELPVVKRQRGVTPAQSVEAPVLIAASSAVEEAIEPEPEPFRLEEVAEEVEAPDESQSAISNRLFDSYSRDISPLATSSEELEDQPAAPPAAIFTLPPEAELHLDATFDENAAAEVEEVIAEEMEAEPAADDAVASDRFNPAPASPTPAQTFAASDMSRDELDHAAANRITSAELDTLSTVELLERLALAIERRRNEGVGQQRSDFAGEREDDFRSAAPVGLAAFTPPVEPQESSHKDAKPDEAPPAAEMPRFASIARPPFDAPAADEELPASAPEEAAYWSAGDEEANEQDDISSLPAALRPVGYDPADDDEALPGYVPPRRIGMAPVEDTFSSAESFSFDNEDVEGEEEEAEVLDEGYSSLLNLSRSSVVRQPFDGFEHAGTDDADHTAPMFHDDRFARNEFESPMIGDDEQAPASVEGTRPFDAPQGPTPEDPEKALRAALAALQRMSGAA
jgi:hypothetical protein